jgi:Phage integrase family
VEYRNYRRRQPLRWNPKRTVKGATVNRELACLHCIFQFALKRKYIGENPTFGVKHFNERIERPTKRMLTVENEHRILEAAPPHLRVAIVLLVQTGGRTYSEGLSLRWDQVDLVHSVIHPGSSVKTTDSAQPLPLSRLACDVLKEWKKEQGSESPFVFPSPRSQGKPIRSVFKPLDEEFGRTEDGFLGYDFLRRYVVVLDYAAEKMTVYDPSNFKYTGSGAVFPVHFRHRWPYITGTIKVKGLDAQSGEFLVDSGSGDAVDHPAILKSTGPLRRIQTGVGLGTPGQGALGRAEYLELGRYRLQGPITSCCSTDPDDQTKIGGEVLRRFTVIFDYPNERIILEPNRNFREPFPNE